MTQPDASKPDLFAKTALASWKINLDRLDKMFDGFSDEDLQQEIAPGKNRIFYLLGHLAAVHDRMFPLLGLGARIHEELDQDFLTNPDRMTPDRISAAALRQTYTEINSKLTRAMEALPAEAWLRSTKRCRWKILRKSRCAIAWRCSCRARRTCNSTQDRSGWPSGKA